jgi:hypothetical protein
VDVPEVVLPCEIIELEELIKLLASESEAFRHRPEEFHHLGKVIV